MLFPPSSTSTSTSIPVPPFEIGVVEDETTAVLPPLNRARRRALKSSSPGFDVFVFALLFAVAVAVAVAVVAFVSFEASAPLELLPSPSAPPPRAQLARSGRKLI